MLRPGAVECRSSFKNDYTQQSYTIHLPNMWLTATKHPISTIIATYIYKNNVTESNEVVTNLLELFNTVVFHKNYKINYSYIKKYAAPQE